MWFIVLWLIGLISGFVDIKRYSEATEWGEISRILLLHQFVVTFGLTALINSYCHLVLGEKVAKMYDWPSGPFQAKYGFWTLTLGVLGLLAIWYEGEYWVAPLVNMYMFGLSGAYTHIEIMIKNKKADFSNVGNVVMDVLYQSFITVLAFKANVW